MLLSMPRDLDLLLYSYLDNPDLYRLSWTCWEAFDRVTYFIHCAFRFHRFLASYLPGEDLHSFLELQRTTGALVTGDALLYFLSRSERMGETLEIIAPARHAFKVVQWLSNSQYETPTEDVCLREQVSRLRFDVPNTAGSWCPLLLNDCPPRTLVSVTLVSRNTPFKIIVHLTQQALIQLVLQQASTAQMNFATYDKIYSLYPLATFEDGLSLVRLRSDHQIPNINPLLCRELNIYFTRQWTNYDVFPYGLRFAGDAHTWTLNINEDQPITSVNETLIANNWLAHRTVTQEYEIHGIAHYSQHLQERYVFANNTFRRLVQRTLAEGRKAQRDLKCKKALDGQLLVAIKNKYNEGGQYLYL